MSRGLADDPRFGRNSARVANRVVVLNAEIAQWFGRLDVGTATRRLDEAGLANARQRSVSEFLAHPSLRGRSRWRDVDTPGGVAEMLLPPVDVAGVAPRMDPVPALGAHTEAILAELGFAGGSIARWRRGRRVIRR